MNTIIMKRILLLSALFVLFGLFSNKGFAQTEAVEIVKYSDYQCPACAYYHDFTEKIKEELGEQVKLTYKNFPLNSHPYAMVAARAAESARKQGKHHKMHNLLFENQKIWTRGNPEQYFIGYAREIGLMVEQFRADINSAEMQKKVLADKEEGINRGVNATPTFFINGKKVEQTPAKYKDFKALVLAELKTSS